MSKLIKKGYVNVQIERDAGGTITPGDLIKYASDGDFEVHDDEGGPALAMFAIEDEYQGNDIDDDYSSGDRVIARIMVRGERVRCNITTSSPTSVAIGDKLISNGDGTLRPLSHDSADSIGEAVHWVGIALETASAGERCTIEIL